jgi:predicted nucleic acid-binding protein
MMVLVDTSIWSLALRRTAADLNPREQKLAAALRELIRDGRARIAGPIRQEILSGIREPERFRKLRDRLRAFDDPVMDAQDYEEAAHMNNQCRARGVSGSSVDFLLCAVAQRRAWQIFTADCDFENYAKIISLQLCRVS